MNTRPASPCHPKHRLARSGIGFWCPGCKTGQAQPVVIEL